MDAGPVSYIPMPRRIQTAPAHNQQLITILGLKFTPYIYREARRMLKKIVAKLSCHWFFGTEYIPESHQVYHSGLIIEIPVTLQSIERHCGSGFHGRSRDDGGTLAVAKWRRLMRRIYDTEGDWGRLLQAFASAAEGQ